jgi:V8-like Glu-specific endopeptidase
MGEGDWELPQEAFEPADALELDLELIGADTRVRVTDTTAAPFRYICNFEYEIAGGRRLPCCTGTLIGPRTVLTAGHCIDGVTPARLRIVPGRNRASEPLGATRAASFILAPGFAATTATDFGIVRLADPIGNRAGWWSANYRRTAVDPTGTSILASGRLPLPAGRIKVNLSGYPVDKPVDRTLDCRPPQAMRQRCNSMCTGDPGRNPLCGTEQWRAYDVTVAVRGGILEYKNDDCQGHSGSPLWVRRHPSMGGRVLVGIQITGDDGTGLVANRAVFITPGVRAWIVANTV